MDLLHVEAVVQARDDADLGKGRPENQKREANRENRYQQQNDGRKSTTGITGAPISPMPSGDSWLPPRNTGRRGESDHRRRHALGHQEQCRPLGVANWPGTDGVELHEEMSRPQTKHMDPVSRGYAPQEAGHSSLPWPRRSM